MVFISSCKLHLSLCLEKLYGIFYYIVLLVFRILLNISYNNSFIDSLLNSKFNSDRIDVEVESLDPAKKDSIQEAQGALVSVPWIAASLWVHNCCVHSMVLNSLVEHVFIFKVFVFVLSNEFFHLNLVSLLNL